MILNISLVWDTTHTNVKFIKYVAMYIIMLICTTSNIIIMGFSTKVVKSGEGSIWSENIGEAVTSWDITFLKTQAIVKVVVNNQPWKSTYPLLEDDNLKPLPFLHSTLAIENPWESTPDYIETRTYKLCLIFNYICINCYSYIHT